MCLYTTIHVCLDLNLDRICDALGDLRYGVCCPKLMCDAPLRYGVCCPEPWCLPRRHSPHRLRCRSISNDKIAPPFFQNGAHLDSRYVFAIGSQHLRCWGTRLESRIKKFKPHFCFTGQPHHHASFALQASRITTHPLLYRPAASPRILQLKHSVANWPVDHIITSRPLSKW